ncbi:hypothetical protein DRQ53_11735 [bacterium]|nr:MAG: hypothetical protein DRQ32_03050 [bacterium]RKZ14350.1 MAG: hypothetical protein DRQ53_11735 [bacterium]
MAALTFLAPMALAGTLAGPILDEGATAELVDIVQLPASDGSAPLNRIGMVREVPDGSGRLFANDLRGVLHVIDGVSESTYMDLGLLRPKLVTNSLAWGFMSFAFHPDFATNGLLYTAHTESIGTIPPNFGPALPAPIIAHSIVTEWQAGDPTSNTFSGTSRELIRVAAPHRFHNLGEIGFDPGLDSADPGFGLLYIAAGDFGSVFRDDPGQLQRLDTVYGCLLRIDPLGGSFERDSIVYPYATPASNPYANDGDPDTFGEIYAHGFRNPQNFHFDRGGNGDLFVTDIGESNLEEVNIAVAGGNYGWPLREGNMALDVALNPYSVFPVPAGDDSLGFEYPLTQYDHAEGNAIAGGLAVRSSIPSLLKDKFIFGDIVNGRIFYSDIAEMLSANDGSASTIAVAYELTLLRDGTPTTLVDEINDALGGASVYRTDLRFSADVSGRLFVTTKQDGFIRELVPVPTGATGAPAARQARVRVEPNPFNPRTVIRFDVMTAGRVRLDIYDVRGQHIRGLVNEVRAAGEQRVMWDGTDDGGLASASGVYLYRLKSGDGVWAGKLSLVR